MRTRIERLVWRVAFAALAGVCASAHALPPLAPKHPLEDPAALKAAFEARIGRPVNVLRFNLGENYSDTLVQSTSVSDEFDRYEATPGQTLDEGTPQKAGSIDCTKKIPFAALDLAVGVRVLTQARAIAAANGYRKQESVELGSDIFCREFAWRAMLTSETNSDAVLELTYNVDGTSPRARQLRDGGWAKVDMKSLLAGTAPPAAAPPTRQTPPVRGDGQRRNFLLGIDADLARVQALVGAPLGFKHISLDETQLSMVIFQPSNKKRVQTYIVDGDDGTINLWHEDDTIPFDCNKPFAVGDLPLDRLAYLIAGAPSMIPPMQAARVRNVHIYRSGLCGSPHIYIEIEDERGYGNIEYDARGELVAAELK